MVTTAYKIAYSEVLEILKYISKEELNKIPIDMLEMFEANASGENKFDYDPTKTLQEQGVSEIARTIIAILFRDFWATPEQRKKILLVQENERERIRKEKYNPDNFFNIVKNSQEKRQTEQIAIIENKEKNVLQKIFDKVKRLFRR